MPRVEHGRCTNRHAHQHNVEPSLQRSHDIAHRTLLIEPLRSTTDAETQHNATYGSHCCCMQQCGIKCSLHTGSKCSHTLLCRWNNLSTSGPRKKGHSLSRLGNTEMAIGGADALPRSARLIALAHWRPRSPTRRRDDRGTPLYSVLALRPSGLGHGAICTTEGTIPSIHSVGA